jgi:hypothetical protein
MTPLSHAQKAVEEHEAKITAQEFYAMIAENPSVFEHWDTPLEITEYVSCRHSKITHLSKYLTFAGKDENEWSASFTNCADLKIATGTFQTGVNFRNSGIQKIENLEVKELNKSKSSAVFWNCKDLETATGTYPGFVTFLHSGITSIKNLHIKNPNDKGIYVSFRNCPNLQTLDGWDLSKTMYIESEKLEAEKKRRAALKKFIKKTSPEELPFL